LKSQTKTPDPVHSAAEHDAVLRAVAVGGRLNRQADSALRSDLVIGHGFSRGGRQRFVEINGDLHWPRRGRRELGHADGRQITEGIVRGKQRPDFERFQPQAAAILSMASAPASAIGFGSLL
jgi:hypothetical protein